MDNAKARKEVLSNLPPRHARGCPQNILRSAAWQLRSAEISINQRDEIMSHLKAILPCLCPKSGN